MEIQNQWTGKQKLQKKNEMEILERKMIISEVKIFIEWIQQQSGDGRGVGELKDRPIKMIQSEGQREK